MSIFVFREKGEDTLNMIVAGKVSRDAELNQKGDRYKFSVCYGKSKFMNCEAYVDGVCGPLAACLEKDDGVVVFGKWREWEYDGKTYSSLTADHIAAQQIPQADAEPEQGFRPAGRAVDVSADGFDDLGDETGGELPF